MSIRPISEEWSDRQLRLEILDPNAQQPRYSTSGSSGMDLHAAIKEPRTLEARARALIPTGIAIAIPPGLEGQIRARSGIALEHGVTVLNSPGTIDCDYRGEIKVLLINLGDAPFIVRPSARIAQLVVAPIVKMIVVPTAKLDPTARGAHGFGHTGS